MRIVYATQFLIPSSPKEASVDLADHIKGDIFDWIKHWYKERMSFNLEISDSSSILEPLPLHRIETSFISLKKPGTTFFTAEWQYPDQQDNQLLWNSRCEWASIGGDIEFSFTLRIISRAFYIVPPDFKVRRPKLIGTIVKKYSCYSGGLPIVHLPTNVGVFDLDPFINILCLKTRILPVVLFSIDHFSERPLADPNEAQDKLVGLAHVFVLEDKWTSFALTDKVGKIYSCFRGAIRIYWPHFSLSSDPNHHPLLFPDQIDSLQSGAKNFSDVLLDEIGPISSFRFVHGPITKKAIEAIKEEKQNDFAALRAEAEQSKDICELYNYLDKEHEALKLENTKLAKRLEETERDLLTSQENWAAYRSATALSRSITLTTPIVVDTDFSNVLAAIEKARATFSDTLKFLDSAFESASESPYGQPGRVFQAFEAMDDVCKRWRVSLERRESIGSFEMLFSKLSFQYKHNESDTSITKWQTEYETNYEGNKVSIEPHLALGKGGPMTCLRIHFFMDEKSRCFIIAHCGRHKTNTTT